MEVTEEFRKMIDEDIKNLKDALSDVSNTKTFEYAKLEFYKELTAKYHPYISKFSDGLYNYYPNIAFYDDVQGESLRHNLYQIYNKLITFKATGYPSLISMTEQQNNNIVLNTSYTSQNTNNNSNTLLISFDQVRQQIKDMPSLIDAEVKEILYKIDELEQIIKSSDPKSKKWENAKGTIKWIADKGVDVGITLLPLLLQIK